MRLIAPLPSIFAWPLSALLALGCKTSGSDEPKPAPSASAARRHVHPPIPAPLHGAMRQDPMTTREPPPPAASVPAKNWNASCLIHRGCATQASDLPECEDGRAGQSWSDLQRIAATLVGKTIDVDGALGLAPIQPTSTVKACAPDACCHSLKFGVVIAEQPVALPLQGFTCTGDDSKLCCPVPESMPAVIARGRLVKGPAGSITPWQLADVSLCVQKPPAMH